MFLLRLLGPVGLVIASLALFGTLKSSTADVVRVVPRAEHSVSCWSDQVSFMSTCSPSETKSPNSGGHVWSMILLNETNATQNGTLSCAVGGQAFNCALSDGSFSIPPNDIFEFTATYDVGSPGTGSVTVSASGGFGSIDNTLTVTIPQPTQPLVLSLTPHNAENLSPAMCVAGCFDARVSYTTPAYFSLDQARSVTLMHSQAQARAMGLVQVDVTDTTTTPGVKMSIRLRRPDSSWVTFTSGTQEIFYSSGSGPNRLAAQFDATTLATGAPEYRLHVRAWSSGGSILRESTAPVRVLILNEKDSEFGWGWSIPGLQRLHEQSDGSILLTEGDGAIRRFELVSCPSTCSYTSPAGEFSTLIRRQFWVDGYKWDRTYRDGTSAVYLTDGRLAYVRDRFGNQTTFAYSGTPARLSSITDPAGKVITFGYGANNKLDWIRDPGNRYSYITINGAKDVTEITDPASVAALKLTYDAQHRVTRRTDRRGGVWDLAYDFAGKLKADTLPTVAIGGLNARPVLRFRSTESILLVDPASGYGTLANPASRVDTSTVRPEITNARGLLTKYALDRWGAATRVEEPLGRVTRMWRNASGQDTLTISPRGDSVRMVWSGSSLTQIVRRPGGRTVNFEYESSYNEITRIFGDADSVWNYWSFGRLDSTRVGRSTDTVTKFRYDGRGRDTLRLDPKGHKTRRFFNAAGWQNLDSIKADSRRTATTYDSYGRDSSVKDPQNNVAVTHYDAINRIIRRIGPSPIYDTTTYSYDSLFLRAVLDAKGQRYAFAANALGWVVSDTNPAGVARTFAYDSNGNVVSMTNRRGQIVSFMYDSLDILRSRVTPDAGTATFVSDPLGRFLTASNSESTDTLKFDVFGRPVAEITIRAGARYELTSTFDPRDRRTQLQMNAPGGWAPSIGYRYNRRSALDTLIDIGGGRTTFAYNSDGLPIGVYLPNGVGLTHGFPSTHTPSKIEYSTALLDSVMGRRYGYDSLTRVSERLNSSGDAGREFSYDETGRLLQYRDFHADACTPIYEYDDPPPGAEPIGWDCSGRVVDQTVTFSYDKVGNRTDLGAIVTAGNRLVKFDGDSLVYDADGNLTRRIRSGADVQRLHWNSLGQLVGVWTSGADSVSFGYDGGNRRVRKWIGGNVVQFIHDADDLFAELNSSGGVNAEFTYYLGIDRPHSVRRAGSTYYFLHEYPNNVSGLLNSTGALLNRYEYRPFGAIEYSSATVPNALTFGGREFDAETGLYFNRARYYDPVLGRFISEDPSGLAAGVNLYAYVSNDPANRTDPTGLDERCELWARYTAHYKNGRLVAIEILEYFEVCKGAPGGGGGGGNSNTRARRVAPDECPAPPPAPPGVDIDKNIQLVEWTFRMNSPSSYLATSGWFASRVDYDAAWDFKTQGMLGQYEAFGNFHYGATGSAARTSEDILLRMAAHAQARKQRIPQASGLRGLLRALYGEGFTDESKDPPNIRAGIQYYNNGCHRR